jgi:hypothetical protein
LLHAWGQSPSHNKAYVLHSLAVVRAAPHRAKDRATSHKQNVVRHSTKIKTRRPWRERQRQKNKKQIVRLTPKLGLNKNEINCDLFFLIFVANKTDNAFLLSSLFMIKTKE